MLFIRFRRKPIALACDIKEMYLQVEIEESGRPYFRLLWRDLDSSREPDPYEFSRVVFGKTSAPMEEIINRPQLEAFSEEYKALLAGKEIPKNSSLSKLCPWLDDKGVL